MATTAPTIPFYFDPLPDNYHAHLTTIMQGEDKLVRWVPAGVTGIVPTSLVQESGEGLGAQAGEAKLTEILKDGGFRHVRRATKGPFNMVLEARP